MTAGLVGTFYLPHASYKLRYLDIRSTGAPIDPPPVLLLGPDPASHTYTLTSYIRYTIYSIAIYSIFSSLFSYLTRRRRRRRPPPLAAR